MEAVLVTGGAGYIGSHACRALAAAGYQPVCYDDFSTGWRDAVCFGPLEEGTLADRATLDRVIAKHAPAAVMHFAARSLVGESVRDPGLYWRDNVAATLTLLEAMRDHDILRLVFSSTAAVYGAPAVSLIGEDILPAPINPYGVTKYTIEMMIKDFSKAHGLSAVILRYFNVAGAAIEGTIGEQHRPETHLIPLALEAALGRRGALSVFGDDYPTADGTCVRDYVHVEDLCNAHLLGLERLLRSDEGSSMLTCNLGIGQGYSVREVLDTIGHVIGKRVPYTVAERREGDPARLVCNPARAAQYLGWHARLRLPEMVGSAAQWMAGRGYAQ